MNIIACIKQVPDTETIIKINAQGTDIETGEIKYIVNPYDEYAVEEAVRIKEKNPGSTVTVISIGPQRTKEALRTCLAIGADRAVHLCDDLFLKGDAHVTATVLAEQIKTQPFDIILMGKQAVDDDCAQVAPAVASLLDLPFVSVINKLEFSPDMKKAKVKREIEGASEIIEVDMPAVFSCQKGLNEPRYPSLKDIMMSKKKEIKEVNLQTLNISPETLSTLSKTKVVKLEYPPKRPPGQIIEGEIHDTVKKLFHLLREEAKIL